MNYPKTDNLYTRNEETQKLNVGNLREPALAQVGSWLVTEKIDGTNIRLDVQYEGDAGVPGSGSYSCFVRGRTDAATLPSNFEAEALPENWRSRLIEALQQLTSRSDLNWAMTVYGEGYGPGIQKCGGSYAPKKSLRIFDVMTYRLTERTLTNVWTERELIRGKPYWRPKWSIAPASP